MPATAEYATTRTVPVTYVCRKCRKSGSPAAVLQLVFSVSSKRTEYRNPSTGRLSSHTVNRWSCNTVPLAHSGDCPPPLQCECGRSMEAAAVRGVYSAKHKCGARCTHAIGPDCECSCGGANHGRGYRA